MPLINAASSVYHGAQPVDAIYARGAKVWPTAPADITILGEPWTLATAAGSAITLQPAPLPGSGWAASWSGTDLVVSIPAGEDLLNSSWNLGEFRFPTDGVPVAHPRADKTIPACDGLAARWRITYNPSAFHTGAIIHILSWVAAGPTMEEYAGAVSVVGDPLGRSPTWLPEFVLFPWITTPPATLPAGWWDLIIMHIGEVGAFAATTMTVHTAEVEWGFGNAPPAAQTAQPALTDDVKGKVAAILDRSDVKLTAHARTVLEGLLNG